MTVAADGARTEPADDSLGWVAGAAATLRARWWLVALAALLGLGLAVAWLRAADYTYVGVLRVAPAPTTARESANIGALTSLATLTGATLEAIPVTPFRLYVEGIRTRELAARLARDPAIMRGAFAKEWDARAGAWREPQSLGRQLARSIEALAGAPPQRWSPPDAARLQAWIAQEVGIDQNAKTPIVTITVASTDKVFAKLFLTRLHRSLDAWLRERTLERTRNNIAYLTSKLPTVALADHRQALYVTLSDQEQRQMLARNPAAYAAEPFGPVTASPLPTAPRQLPLLVLGLGFGLFAGLVAALALPRRSARA